jgi:hypothetical protein
MVAETITTAPALQAGSQAILDQVIHPELVKGGGGKNRNDRQPHAPMQCRPKVQSEIKADGVALPMAGRKRLVM